MKLKLDKEHLIQSDSRQYILVNRKPGVDKKGHSIMNSTVLGYYSNLTNALMAYKDLKIKNSNINDINKLIEEIRKSEEEILRAVKTGGGIE